MCTHHCHKWSLIQKETEAIFCQSQMPIFTSILLCSLLHQTIKVHSLVIFIL